MSTGGGGGAAVTCVLESVLQGYVLFGDGVIGRGGAREVHGGDWGWIGSGDGSLVGWRAVEGVLEDTCAYIVSLWWEAGSGEVFVYLSVAWQREWEGNGFG